MRTRTKLLSAGVMWAGVAVGGCGCGAAEPPEKAPPPAFVPGSAPIASAPLPAPITPAPPTPPMEVGFDPAGVVLILDDARLAEVKSAMAAEAPVRAVEKMTAAIGALAQDAPEKAPWTYQLAKLRIAAGDPLGAAKAFESAAGMTWPLAEHARYQAADLYEKVGKPAEALALARAVPAGLSVSDAVTLVIAEALSDSADIEGAATVWRGYLGRTPRPANWVSVTLRFARALLNRPSQARAEEALQLARKVLDASEAAGLDEAQEIEKKALATIPNAKQRGLESPSSDALIARARKLVGAGKAKEAVKVTEALVTNKSLAPKKAEKRCEARLLHAEALGKLKRKAESADAYEAAVDDCQGTPQRVAALFSAGKALSNTGFAAKAVKRFAQVEKEFPAHRLADDARFYGAKATLIAGDEAGYSKMILAMPDDYPEGDMVNDALFDLALFHVEKKDWAASKAPLQKAYDREKDNRERMYDEAGRFGYYLGRASFETGDAEKGKTVFASVIREYPLTYYMALAYARYAEKDATGADQTLKAAVAREAAEGGVGTGFVVPPHPSLKEPVFLRAVELVRQGDVKLARSELDLAGFGNKTAPRELLWASVLLLNRAGAPETTHSLLRAANTSRSSTKSELAEWLGHYPVGRWRTAWEIAYPRPFNDVVAQAAAAQGIPEALVYAISREESAFNPRVVSHAGAIGLMQLMPKTAKLMAKPLSLPHDTESLKKPHVNVPLGSRYLSVLRKKFPDNVLLAIPGYNAGGGAPARWIDERPDQEMDLWVERIPYEETRQYTKRVIGSLAAYEMLYWPTSPSEARAAPRLTKKPVPPAPAASGPVLVGPAEPDGN